jgi:hypothetical protein
MEQLAEPSPFSRTQLPCSTMSFFDGISAAYSACMHTIVHWLASRPAFTVSNNGLQPGNPFRAQDPCQHRPVPSCMGNCSSCLYNKEMSCSAWL